MIKTILKSILKNKLISIFLVIEFTITIYLSLEAIATYEIISTKRKTITSMFDVKSTLVIKSTKAYEIHNFKTYYDIPDTLKSINGVKKVGYYDVEDPKLNVKDTLGGIKKYVFLNSDMLDIVHVKNDKGSIITGDVFRKNNNESENPILTGSSLKAIGKSFDISMGPEWKKTYKSIETLKDNYSFPNKGYISETPINLNNCVMLSISDDKTSSEQIKANAVINYFFVKIDTKNVNKVKDSINKRFEEKGLEINIATVEEDLNNYIKDNEEFFIAQLRITICLAVFSILGTAVTLILSVNKRKREFGIRMSTGASKFYLLRLVYGEVMLLILVSYLFSLMLYSRQSEGILYSLGLKVYELFNPLFSIKYLLCVFTLLFLVSLTVIKTILKMQPRELIGGAK